MRTFLEITHGCDSVRRMELRADAVIGRSKNCALRIASPEVSRRHCLVRLATDGAFVRDLGSSNGTFLDGRRIAAGEDVPLEDESRITIGGIDFVVRLDLPEASPEAQPDRSDFTSSWLEAEPLPPAPPTPEDTCNVAIDETGSEWPAPREPEQPPKTTQPQNAASGNPLRADDEMQPDEPRAVDPHDEELRNFLRSLNE